MRYFARVLRYARPFWKLAVASVVMTVVVSVLGLAAPWPLKILFDSVLGRHPLPGPVEPLLRVLGAHSDLPDPAHRRLRPIAPSSQGMSRMALKGAGTRGNVKRAAGPRVRRCGPRGCGSRPRTSRAAGRGAWA